MASLGPPTTNVMDTNSPLSPEPHDDKLTTKPVAKPANALTPPTSEEMNHDSKHDGEESELSELDMDEDDMSDMDGSDDDDAYDPDEDELVNGGEDGESKEVATKLQAQSKGGDEDGIPYTFTCPESHEQLLEILGSLPVTKLPVAVQRIRALYHPKLDAKNKERLGNFFLFSF